jgi:hypothetical protein
VLRQSWIVLLSLLFALSGLVGCGAPRDDDDTEEDDDDATGDDDDSAGDDDDTGDDDDSTNDPPVFLDSFDFRLVQLENAVTGQFDLIQGQMDIYVSDTVFLAELTTTAGDDWTWQGPLVLNESRFEVTGQMELPGVPEFWITIEGNFLAGADRVASQNCLTGLGNDNETLNQGEIGIQFAWYGCQTDAPAAAVDRAGTYNVSVTTHADNCGGAWSTPSWSENWAFDGRMLVVSRGSFTGYGIVSDDGQVFRYSMLETQLPGRSLKVVGDFTAPTGKEEAIATGYCSDNTTGILGGVLDLDYP